MKQIFTLALCAYSLMVFGQQQASVIQDTSKVNYLDELVVSANRIAETRRTVAQQVTVINTPIIRNFNAQTSADLIQNTGTVAMQRSQQGGGSPILRGFEASRVLLVIDGVRMNNLIYRAGHLQNVITIDNNTLDRAEVLFGPSSTVYGSDALGGVIHFFTRNPELSTSGKTEFHSGAFVRYASANNENAGHVDLSINGGKIASFTSFTYSDFGDLRMGEKTNPSYGEQFGVRNQYVVRADDNQSDLLVDNSDPYVQKFSGYRQWDLLQKILFRTSDKISHLVNFQYSNTNNVPRYDRLTDPGGGGVGLRFAEWYYGPQKRVMGSYRLGINGLGALADNAYVLISYQNVEESRHDRRFNNNIINHRVENVDVWGLTADFQKKSGRNILRYGIDGQFNAVKSVANRENIVTGVLTTQSTRYPDGNNTMNTLSLFATHTLVINDQLSLNDGIRLGYSSLHSTFKSQEFFPFPFNAIEQKNFVGSGSIGLNYTPGSWKFSALGSTGYRVPNVDDLAKVFDTVTGSATSTGKVIVPNPDLGPEKTLNGEIGITRFFGSAFRLEGVAFVTRFYDVIVTAPSTFNGQATIVFNGFPADVYSNQNRDKALLYGFNIGGSAQFTRNLSLRASYNYTHGDIKNESGPDTPLDHIPPIFGRVGLQYNTLRFQSELFSNFNGWKYKSRYSSSGEDNLQYATPEGMPSWYTINFRASYDVMKSLTVQVGVDNIMDLQYRLFASGINAPGRNIFVTIRAKI